MKTKNEKSFLELIPFTDIVLNIVDNMIEIDYKMIEAVNKGINNPGDDYSLGFKEGLTCAANLICVLREYAAKELTEIKEEDTEND